MTTSWICNTSKSAIGRSAFSLNAKKCPDFQIGDVVYMSSPDHVVHSRLEVTEKNANTITLPKVPETSISMPQEEILSQVYTEKFSMLTKQDSEILEKCFIHDIRVFPFYDYKSDNQETNAVLDALKKCDLKVEIYPDAISSSDDLINQRLNEPTSVIILDNYGVVTFKCLEVDPLSGNEELANRLNNQLKSTRIRSTLSSSPQLTNYNQELTINHLDVIVFESDKTELMSQMNELLSQANRHVKIFNRNSFVDYLKKLSKNEEVILNEIKRTGIMQSLLPKYINSKTVNLTSSPLNFVPDDTFELDDIQKDTLHRLNERTSIKASAGSGKTIILLAKAYEVAKANPDKQFLLLCYNRELSKDIQNQADNTGRSIANLKIITFDKFLIDLGVSFNSLDDSKNAEFAARKKAFVEQVMSGKLKLSYGGIFVDEVQQMKPEWLDALFECLDEEKYMIVSGDYYQSINPSLIEDDEDDDFVEEGDSSDYVIGGRKFKTVIFDKNYRNTKIIAKTLKNMVFQMNQINDELSIPAKKEKVLGHAYKENVATPCCIKMKGKAQEKITHIERQIDLLIDKYHCAPSDILLVYPRNEKWHYYLEEALKTQYDVCNFKNPNKNKSGIKMGTIDKIIGLDFKAVVFFDTSGLEKLLRDPHSKEYINDLEALKNQKLSIRKNFASILRRIYVACSRARDILIVLDDTEKDNIFTNFIKESGMEEE